ncbi:hypothetical protein PHPALM_20064 [Phytophthora palmivora]|uniref:Uncharacterized protein n=1 Tax=Phytophthora palmivora TaxID=4796 RepID=A0A2P4XFT5_9STRA|nr:hypothetical protein PHPALM_20064 [Phytophthora palmivora]
MQEAYECELASDDEEVGEDYDSDDDGEEENEESDQVLGLERFNGEDYSMWRDKVITRIETLDEKYQRGLLKKDQPEATVVMMDFLDGTLEKPVISVSEEVTQEEAKARRWRHQHWTRARSELLNLFNQALPNVF